MRFFKLPDLGEGLQEAEIIQWHVQPGDKVATDQIMVSVETAKAIVDIPSPQAGIVDQCFGAEGDLIHIGEALVEYAGEQDNDQGTVVGELNSQIDNSSEQDFFIVGTEQKDSGNQEPAINILPGLRQLAADRGVNLTQLQQNLQREANPGETVTINRQAILAAERKSPLSIDKRFSHLLADGQKLRGPRRTMAKVVSQAQQQVALVTVCDQADIHAWREGSGLECDITIRLVQAMAYACQQQPQLNLWFDGEKQRAHETVDLGVAVDTADGLFVPVLRDIGQRNNDDLRQGLDRLKQDILTRTIPSREMQGATIILSNVGSLGGRYSTPMVIPPMVAILAAGRKFEQLQLEQGKACSHPYIPLSLSFDHRCVTGAEATLFLRAVIEDLQKAQHSE